MKMLLAMLFAGLWSGQDPAPPVGAERFGIYVLVDDVPRAEIFYRRLFSVEPQVRTPALVGFDVAGGLFALAPRALYGTGAAAGGAVRPFIRVRDVDAAFAHARTVAPGAVESEAVVTEGPFRFFRLRDPEGNVLEFFSVAGR